MSLRHRKIGYQLLSGSGLEIGALHEKAALPSKCKVEYCDAISKEQATKLFPEIKHHKLVDVKYICNLDEQGLNIFKDNIYDFIILSHVIEHVANPINVVKELFRVVKPGGIVLIAAPDKTYTFDKRRGTTSFKHVLDEYRLGVKEVTDEHYIDFIKGVHSEWLQLSKEKFNEAIKTVKSRREHAHVWTSDSFKDFLLSSFKELNISARLIMENKGFQNGLEYYSLWQKTDDSKKWPLPEHSFLNKIRLTIGI